MYKLLAFAGLYVCASFATWAQSQDFGVNVGWLPLTEEERQVSAPKVDPSAGVEALFWRVHVFDEIRGGRDLERAMYHYVRLKIFNQSGKESASTIEIPYDEDSSVTQIGGRTIRPDGTVVELKSDAIFDREVVRIGKLRRKVKSFAMPAVEPGAIVEYRWKEIQHNARFKYARLQFQREYPIQKITYFVKPLSSDYVAMPTLSLWPFNCQPTPLKLDNKGLNFTTIENMPAFKEEPYMPAEAVVRSWALLFYHDGKKRDPESYWIDVGKDRYKTLKTSLKVTDEVKAAAAEALKSAGDADKVLALLRHLRGNVRDLFDPSVTDAERAKVIARLSKDRPRTSAEILESKIATPTELNLLFAALATHAGLDARPALVADRENVPFDTRMLEEYFLPGVDMAVKHGEEWRLYDATARRLPVNMVSWREEGMPALLSDPKKPQFIKSPLSPAEASTRKGVARLELSPDGTLSGTLEESFTGHLAAEKRGSFDRESAERQREIVKKEVSERFASAEVSDIHVENANDGEKPFLIRYSVSIPGYAQATGKRLFFAPLYFQRGDAPLFQSADRKFNIEFHYGWQEIDEITLRLPEGYQLDNADNPGGINLGDPGSYDLRMAVNDRNELSCSRRLVFGRNGAIRYSKDMYSRLKTVFDEIHARDSHTLALRRP